MIHKSQEFLLPFYGVPCWWSGIELIVFIFEAVSSGFWHLERALFSVFACNPTPANPLFAKILKKQVSVLVFSYTKLPR